MFRIGYKSDNDLNLLRIVSAINPKSPAKSPTIYSNRDSKTPKLISPFLYKQKSFSARPEKMPISNRNQNRIFPRVPNPKIKPTKIRKTYMNECSSDCECILCIDNNLNSNFGLFTNDFLILDSKNFINCINNMKPTIKIERESIIGNFPDSSKMNPKQTSLFNYKNQDKVKVLSAKSRIKLWNQDEVMNVISTEILNNEIETNLRKKTPELSRDTISSMKNKYLNNIYEDFSTENMFDRSKTPFYNKTHSEKVIRNNNVDYGNILSNYPSAPPVTPLAYRVPMNSAQSFYKKQN